MYLSKFSSINLWCLSASSPERNLGVRIGAFSNSLAVEKGCMVAYLKALFGPIESNLNSFENKVFERADLQWKGFEAKFRALVWYFCHMISGLRVTASNVASCGAREKTTWYLNFVLTTFCLKLFEIKGQMFGPKLTWANLMALKRNRKNRALALWSKKKTWAAY